MLFTKHMASIKCLMASNEYCFMAHYTFHCSYYFSYSLASFKLFMVYMVIFVD